MRILLLAVLLSVSDPQAPAARLVDFPALGQAFITEHCDAKATTPCALEGVLTKGYVELDLGPYDLEIPHSLLEDKPGLDFLKELLGPLTTSVRTWVDWQGAGASIPPETLAAVQAWMAAWRPVSSSTIEHAKSRNIVDVMSASDEEKAALRTMETACDQKDKLALVMPEGKQLTIILSPTRLDFMRWNGYAGLLDETSKALNWFDDAAQWTQFWMGWRIVLALEYASWNGFDPSFKASQPMKKVGKGVLGQHVVQQSTAALLHACRPGSGDNRHEGALALLMTIDSAGEVNTIDGAGGVGTSGGKTRPYSKFVPGGNPKGGTLPARSSASMSVITESRWRKGHGADGFVGPLKTGLAEAQKAAKSTDKFDPLCTWVLHQEDYSGKHFIHAPFFGPHADDQEYPPADYLVDYAEFYRAYKAGFFYFLQHTGVDAKNPEAKWNELMRALVDVKNDPDFDAAVTKVYGLPISDKDGTTDTLEWRFLKTVSAKAK